MVNKEFGSVQTLTTSSTLLDQDRPFDSTSSSAASSPTLDPPKAGSLPKSLSSSKLNARAPEFIPRCSSTSSLNVTPAISPTTLPSPSSSSTVTSPGTVAVAASSGLGTPTATGTQTQQASFVIPQPPGPPTLVHVYATTPAVAGTTLITTHVPAPATYHVPVQYNIGGVGGYIAAADQKQPGVTLTVVPPPPVAGAKTSPTDSGSGSGSAATSPSNNLPADEVSLKILNQVEYYFSDLNVATTDHLIRFMNKDPEGYVPMSVVASFKKIKALVSCHSQLANILRSSEKLVVSEDGKKIKRLHRLTKSDMEELESRIVVAENLPEDHCHQTLMKIFSAVGSVKTIRTCQPQTSNGGVSPASRAAKSDGMFFSNKLHAFVEYESTELAEKAVAELNDENNWRNGLKVRVLIRAKAKSSQARVKKAGQENESSYKDSDGFIPEDSVHSDASNELSGEEHHDVEQKKACNRGRGKGRGRPQYQTPNNRGSIMGPPPALHISVNNEQPITNKHPSVPRMPDGTRGFSMGRGKPVAIQIS